MERKKMRIIKVILLMLEASNDLLNRVIKQMPIEFYFIRFECEDGLTEKDFIYVMFSNDPNDEHIIIYNRYSVNVVFQHNCDNFG